MDRTSLTAGGLVALAIGVAMYLLGVSGALWESSPATDVGLTGFSLLFVLLGLAVLWARPTGAAAA